MTPRSRRLVPLLAAAALSLAACSGSAITALRPKASQTAAVSSAPATSAPATTQPGTTATAPSAPTGPTASLAPTSGITGVSATVAGSSLYQAPALHWKPCDGTFECSTLTVPVDYSEPGGKKYQLAVERLRSAKPGERIGSMFINPGGPGGSGLDFIAEAPQLFPRPILDHFDIITFDPRGVAASDGVHCATNSQLDSYLNLDPDPATPALRADYDTATKAFVAGCQSRSGSALTHVGTTDAARDIDVLRAALGEDKITYFGFSYGTYLGTVLLAEAPTHVRFAVLDGAVDPKLNLLQFVQGQGQAFENALNRWFAWCTTANNCDFAAGSAAANAAKWDKLDAQAAANPLVSDGRKLTSAEFLTGTTYPLYNKGFWPDLGTALQSAVNGDASGLLGEADSYNSRSASGSYDDSLDANTVINCLDHPGPETTDAYDQAADALRKTAPRLGPGIVYQQSSCAGWPVAAEPPPITEGAGAPPVIVISTTFDPATPYGWGVSLAKDLPTATLLTHNGDGHTAYGPAAPCVENIVDASLISGKAIAAGQKC